MCALCSKYGTELLSDEKRLREALAEAAKLLKMKLFPKQRDHVMEFVDKIMGGEIESDREVDSAWESNRDNAQERA